MGLRDPAETRQTNGLPYPSLYRSCWTIKCHRAHTHRHKEEKEKNKGEGREMKTTAPWPATIAIDIPDIKTARVYFWFFSFSSSPAQQQTAAVITNKSDLNVLQQWGVFVA
jgi:hypothetical protein